MTKPNRRHVLAAATAALATPFLTRAASAQEWPAKPVRVIVPYPPGGGADTVSRIFFAKLSERLGQQFVIDNRGGAGGTIAAAVAAKADPDGYTVLYDATAFSVNPFLYPKLSFDYDEGLPAGVPRLAGAEHPGRDAVRTGARPSPTSSRSRRRHRAGSTLRRPATARCSICRWRCSATSPAPRSITSRIAAAVRR